MSLITMIHLYGCLQLLLTVFLHRLPPVYLFGKHLPKFLMIWFASPLDTKLKDLQCAKHCIHYDTVVTLTNGTTNRNKLSSGYANVYLLHDKNIVRAYYSR